jgi:serine/threonine protein kinase
MPPVRRRVGRYEIVRELGRGGLSTMYLARQQPLGRDVALKELSSVHASAYGMAERFLREARLASGVSHPNIVTVLEYFEHDGTPYIAMEYLPGGSLRPYVGRLSLAQFAGVMEGVLTALAHAEGYGIVHRDLKPENVLVSGEGRVKIGDFGLAEVMGRAGRETFPTGARMTFGTPSYMAPEQAMGQDVGVWSDLYSVGVMAWEQVVGRTPFHDSQDPMVILMRQVNEAIPSWIAVNSQADPGISAWIDRLLVKDPRNRQRSPAAAWEELEDIVVAMLGPLWRRRARLPTLDDVPDSPRALTPAPFESQRAIPPIRSAAGIESLFRDAVGRGVVPAGVASLGGHPVAAASPAPAQPSASDSRSEIPGAAAEPIDQHPTGAFLPIPAPDPTAAPAEAVEQRATGAFPTDSASPGRSKPRRRIQVAIGVPAAAVSLAVLFELAKRVLGWFELAGEPVEQANPPGDIVDCTVFEPPSASPGQSILVQVFAHLAKQTEDARALATEFDPGTRRRVFQSLNGIVPRGATLTFELRIRNAKIDEAVQTLVWRGRAESVQFEAVLPTHRTSDTLIGTVLISLDGAPIGHVKFKLDLATAPSGNRREPVGEIAKRYRSAFVSYASTDRDKVLARVQMLNAVKINYFNDLLELEPGERWWPRLQAAIDECHLFLLFWSSHAKRSIWVRKEVEHALHRQAGDELASPEIRPVIIEGPPPVPPWDELGHLHFNDRVLYFLSPGGGATIDPT